MHHRPPGNCNYAAVLIVWDRMFGTFKPEDLKKDHYGLAKPLASFDPFWANVQVGSHVFLHAQACIAWL